MNLKNFTLFMMTLVLSLVCLTGCGSNDGLPLITGDSQNTVPSDSEGAAPSAADPLTLNVNGEEIDGDGLVMMTINGLEVPYDEYRYMYNFIDGSYFSGGDETYWQENSANFPMLLQYTEMYILENNWGNLLAKEYDIKLTEEDLAQIEESLAEQSTYFESEEDYRNALAETGITEDLLRRLISQTVMCNRAYEELFNGEDKPLYPNKDERGEYDKSYVRAYHVLISNDHFADEEGYEDASDEELKAAAYDYAKEIAEQIKNGADIYELAQTIGDDPGMTGNEEGYTFTFGEMVEPFETAAFALEKGGISDIVETDYGYHIIQRLEPDYASLALNTYVDDMLENADVGYCEYYDSLTYESIK